MFDRWTWRMAWRDSRGNRRRLLLYVTSMVLGVAALVAINSFGLNLRETLDEEAKALFGADLSFEAEQPFTDEMEALIDSIGGEPSRRISFTSMAYFPHTGGTRLSTVRAVEGGYPFYGSIETDPPEASRAYREGRNALLDGTLMEQFDVAVGDSVRIGETAYRVAGRLTKTPRESAAFALFSPRIYIPIAGLDTTLLSFGSRADYEVYFKLPADQDPEALRARLEDRLRAADVRIDTVEEVRDDWDEGLTNLYRFLSLIGFIALLLGGLGVASAVHVYVKQRVETVAVLRCFGAKAWRTFQVYLIQAALLGLVGAVAGAALGIAVQVLLPVLLSDFLPVEVSFRVAWSAVAVGLALGLGVTLLFALLPLLDVRRVSPLQALRASYEPAGRGRDPLKLGLYALLGGAIVGVAVLQAPVPVFGVGYAAGVAVVFGLLALVARGITAGARRFFPASWSYVWRQGLANLYRPQNQTLVLMLALGLGTFLIVTLLVSQDTLLKQVEFAGEASGADLIFFDIQPDQLAGVREEIEAQDRPVVEQVPIVTMRLQAVNGRTIDAMRADSTVNLTWAHRREYRSTYRDALTEAEEVIEGTFVPAQPAGTDVVPVSVEEEIARELEVGVGDTLTFDVQGVPMTTTVASLRTVDWRRVQTNFFVVFPTGVLEEAPQFHVVVTRAGGEAASAALQQAVVARYPNVSAVDLSLLLNVFDALVGRMAFVIRFMALFSVLTGLVVLAGAVVVSRFQRMEESVLLKTLGASRRQVVRIMLVEYLLLGLFAAATGLVLALGGGWALARFVFETPLVVEPLPLLAAVAAVTGLTMLIGLVNSRGIYDRPPLEVLRAEA